jgi:hypothetical protein
MYYSSSFLDKSFLPLPVFLESKKRKKRIVKRLLTEREEEGGEITCCM